MGTGAGCAEPSSACHFPRFDPVDNFCYKKDKSDSFAAFACRKIAFFGGRFEVSFVQKEPLVGEMELIGARLNQARMTANLALQDIADRTKISLRFLKAIENDDFSALPGRAYIFGFTKAFARAVGLDEESVVAALREKMQLAGIDQRSTYPKG